LVGRSLLCIFCQPFPVGPKKKQILVDKADDDLAVDGYDALDDYDFM
jgi:hypothetical protein